MKMRAMFRVQETPSSSERNIFFVFIFLSAILWTLGPIIFYQTPHQDVIEGIAWGNQWQWGYNKMPPLTAWLCAGITWLFHGDIGFPVYMLAQVFVLMSYAFVWKMARVVADERTALISILLISGILYYNASSINLIPDPMSTPVWAMATYYTYRAFSSGRFRDWILLGFAGALTIYVKYSAPLLLLPLFIATLAHPLSREKYKTKGPYLALFFMFFLLTPHILWAIKEVFPGIAYLRNGELGPMSLPVGSTRAFVQSMVGSHFYAFGDAVINQAFILLPVAIIFLPLYRGRQNLPPDETNGNRSFAYYVISASAWGPLLLTLLVALVLADHILPRWSTPYYSFMGLWLLLTVRPLISIKKLKQVIGISLFVFFASLIAYWSYFSIILPNTGRFFYTKMNPMPIAEKTSALWKAHQPSAPPLKYIAGSHYLTAYISVYGKLIPFMGPSLGESSWINLKDLRCHGAIFDYEGATAGPSEETKQSFPTLQFLGMTHFPYGYPGKYAGMGTDVNFYLLPPDPKAC